MLKLLAPIYQKLGFDGKADDEHLDILLRKKIVSLLKSLRNVISITAILKLLLTQKP